MHHCVCRATLQFSNTDPKQCTKYAGCHLVVPHEVQYNNRLYPAILEPQNHHSPLIDPVTWEPCPMEVVGDFKAVDPIFKGSYGDSFLYSEDDLAQLRWQKVYLPTFQEEIPVPPVPSYLQNSELAAAKQSPHRVVAPDTSVESPKTRHSRIKSGPLRGTGCSSNTSTLKRPDTTSTKKPSRPQEPTPHCLAKSPQAHSSWKHGHSPSPATESDGGKRRNLHRIDSTMVDTTLPIGSSTMDTFRSLTGSLSEVVEPLAPSITSTPLGKAGPREGQTISSDSRHSSASLFTSLSFNIPGLPSVGFGSLTPSVPSIAGSHHISSTWPSDSFPSRPSAPWLTIDQANSIFGLASKCQVLDVRLAKDFQMLSGLEAIHRNSVQGMAHEMLTLGCSAHEAAYVTISRDDITEAERKAMTRRLHSEADAAWKKMHEVMYNHQLEYDRRLSDFLKEAEAMLANMRDQVWTAVHALTESEGVTFEDCLSLAPCILPLLPQIPMDISYDTQIPLTIAYCLESSVYRRWHPKQGGVSPFHMEVRASWTLTKVLGGEHCQDSDGVDRTPSPAASEGSAGLGRSQDSRARSRSHSRSITSHHSRQSGSAQSLTTKDDKESSSGSEPCHTEGDAPHNDEYMEICGGDAEVLSNGQADSDGDEGPGRSPIRNTLSGVSHVFATHEETDVESDHEEKTPPAWQKWRQPSPIEETYSKESEESSSEEEQPTDEALCNKAQQQAWHLDTNFNAWWRKKIAKSLLGWIARDTMICDLPKHGKVQPNHLDLVGPPLEYMHDCQVFEGIQLDIYDLCQFYILGMMGDPPEFPAPWEPTTHRQV